ncbi:metalloregulator ArsR/SmtB family transcription factor [Microbacterium sp. SS28]|uniref:ArsR/SmtB family transcription factor n=1 Tax=Microbacterium sp. SS28 TaxID=2919948 RepID=UPI0027DFFB70|nr:metalloregulator ArsR/SmtB family transcription factor [Microbacterium sp. SS28]
MHALDILGDPVRRRIVELLADGERSAGEIGDVIQREFAISQPAVSQHLRVLRESGFATVRAEGTRRLYMVDPAPLQAADAWFDPFRRSGSRASTRWAQSSRADAAHVASPTRTRTSRRRMPRHPAIPRPTPARARPHTRNGKKRRPDMVDVNAQIDAVERGVETTDRDGEAVRVQRLVQEYRATLDDAWDAVTSADRIPRWFLPVSGDLRVGGRYQFEGNAGGEILECSPPVDGAAAYRATWEFGGGVTWVTVRVTETGPERTRVELEHVARVADVPDELWAQFGPAGTGIGWDSGFLGLALYLGSAVDGPTPEEGQAWMLSDEGKAFTRRSSEAWAAAHAADGADPEVAARAAAATAALYMGVAPHDMGEDATPTR